MSCLDSRLATTFTTARTQASARPTNCKKQVDPTDGLAASPANGSEDTRAVNTTVKSSSPTMIYPSGLILKVYDIANGASALFDR